MALVRVMVAMCGAVGIEGGGVVDVVRQEQEEVYGVLYGASAEVGELADS